MLSKCWSEPGLWPRSDILRNAVVTPRTETAALRIIPVAGRALLHRFITLPERLYADDPCWIAPLRLERKVHLDPRRNPFFQNAEVRLWLAERGARAVGRISAQINREHLSRYQDATGHFGFIEAEDDPVVFALLFETAEGWLRHRGMQRVMGPFSLSINDESGLLIAGFDTPPSVMMGHGRPWYGARVEQCGYRKAKDLIAYTCELASGPPCAIRAFCAKLAGEAGLRFRFMDKARFDEEIALVVAIFNDAWADNWGFLPFSQAEMRHLAQTLKPLLRPEDVVIGEVDGTPAAMAVCVPNINEAVADLRGQLLPFGWAKALWRLKIAGLHTARVPLMGVLRRYRGSPVSMALALGVIEKIREAHRRKGVRSAELSWILEDNMPMRRLIEQSGGRAYKTYRIFGRDLAQ